MKNYNTIIALRDFGIFLLIWQLIINIIILNYEKQISIFNFIWNLIFIIFVIIICFLLPRLNYSTNYTIEKKAYYLNLNKSIFNMTFIYSLTTLIFTLLILFYSLVYFFILIEELFILFLILIAISIVGLIYSPYLLSVKNNEIVINSLIKIQLQKRQNKQNIKTIINPPKIRIDEIELVHFFNDFGFKWISMRLKNKNRIDIGLVDKSIWNVYKKYLSKKENIKITD